MLKIRLTRRGKKNKAFFRLVVAEHTSPIKGRFLEALGFWDPHSKEKKFKEDRIKHWLEKGAQCSDSVHNLLVGAGIVEAPKRAIRLKKKEKPAEEPGKTPVSTEAPAAEKKEEEAAQEAGQEKAEKPEVVEEKIAEKTEEKAVPEEKKAEEK